MLGLVSFARGDGYTGGGGLSSGVSPIVGGTDQQVCFNDAGTLSCGDAGFTYNKTTDSWTLLGVAGIANGTAAAPALTFTSDPDIGIYRVGANILAVTAAGVANTLFSSNTVADTAQAQLFSPTASAINTFGTAGPGADNSNVTKIPNTGTYLGGASAGVILAATNATGAVRFWSGGTALGNERWQIDSSGNFAAVGTSRTITSTGLITANNGAGATSSLVAQDNGIAVFDVLDVPGVAANGFTVRGQVAGSSPILAAVGTDTNLNIALTPKGTGNVNVTVGGVALAGTVQKFPKTFTATYNPASLAAGTTRCDAVSVTGIQNIAGPISCSPGASLTTSCVIGACRMTAANQVTVCWQNTIDAVTACDEPSSTWDFGQAQ